MTEVDKNRVFMTGGSKKVRLVVSALTFCKDRCVFKPVAGCPGQSSTSFMAPDCYSYQLDMRIVCRVAQGEMEHTNSTWVDFSSSKFELGLSYLLLKVFLY